jgi:hypothetical protein
MSRRTNLRNIVQHPNERVAILKPGRHAFSPSTHIRRLPTFGTPGARVTCISSSTQFSWSSGRGSAAAWIGPVQKRTRFARKPLMKTHWSGVVGGFCFPYNQERISAWGINVARGTDWVKTTVVIHYGSPNLAPNITRPTVTERQRNFGLHIVVHERSGSP